MNVLIWIAIALSSCTPSYDLHGQKYVYDLGEPESVVKLNDELRELSGMVYANGRLYCHQDENGRIYTLNPVTGAIMEESKCWGKGDFEDIALAGDRMFLMKSNGNVYETAIGNMNEESTIKYDLGFNSDWNFEGITYWPSKKGLLIAAKRKSSAPKKEIFLLPLDDLYAVGIPEFVIVQNDLEKEIDRDKETWAKRLSASISEMTYAFNPAAIAVHPLNGEIYIISSPIPQLAIYTDKWKLRKLIPLDSKMYPQPESMCFDDKANLYIGNEGRSGKANILKFKPQ